MRKLALLAILGLVASPAMAGFTVTNAGPIPSDGPAFTGTPQPTHGYFTYNFTGATFAVGDVVFTGTLTDAGQGSYASEARINIADPAGSWAGWNPASGTTFTVVTVTGQTVSGGGAFWNGTPGTWQFAFSESYDDPGGSGAGTVDAYWSNLSLQFTDAPPPPVCAWGEDFENGLPADWTYIDNTGNGGWDLTSVVGRDNYAGTGDAATVDSDFYGSVDIDAEMITKVFEVPVDAHLVFNNYFRTYTGADTADVEINDGSGWVNLATYAGGTFSGQEDIDISAYAGDDVQIRFHYYDANYEWYWQIDDFCITPEPGSLALMLLGGLAALRRRR